MAAVVSEVSKVSSGIPTLVYAKITMDDSYATSGESVVARDFGLVGIKAIFASNADGYGVKAVRSNDSTFLIKVFAAFSATTSAGAPVEAVSGADLSAVVVSVLVVGN